MNPFLSIYTFADKRPDFILRQLRCFRRFLPPANELNWNFTVFDNAKDQSDSDHILGICVRNQYLNYYQVPDEAMNHSNPNAACAAPLNWAWENVIGNNMHDNEIVMILDSDMFLAAPFDPVAFMSGYHVAGTKQRRGNACYIWNGLMFFKGIKREWAEQMDFSFGQVAGSFTDVGGAMHYLFQKYPEIKLRDIPHTSHIHPDNDNMHVLPDVLREAYLPEYRMELYAGAFLHYGRGSNWDKMPHDYHHSKTVFLDHALNMALKGRANFREREQFIFCKNAWEK